MKPLLGFLCWMSLGNAMAQAPKDIEMNVVIPTITGEAYHRPYVAIWLEDNERKPIANIAVWWQKDKWLKDLRQWWRKGDHDVKAGVDGFSGATKKPGAYPVKFTPVDKSGKTLPAGRYILNFEASREDGGRTHVKQEIELGGKAQEFTIAATKEFGAITIKVPGL